jgi:hypothetical protein
MARHPMTHLEPIRRAVILALPEITDLALAMLVEEHVARLQVAMYHALFVKVRAARGNLAENSLLLIPVHLGAMIVNKAAQVARAQLRHDTKSHVVVAYAVKLEKSTWGVLG